MRYRLTLFLMALFLSVLPALAQQGTVISPALEEHILKIEAATSALRGLEQISPIIRRFPQREEAVAHFRNIYENEISDEEFFRETQFYIGFDLLPAGTDLRAVYLSFLTSTAGVAGYYDTESKDMNVLLLSGGELGDRLPILEQITYAHEYTHALQDQHFDLQGLGLDDTSNPDRLMAVLSLIEGDATLVMTGYLQEAVGDNPLVLASVLLQGFRVGAFTLPDDAPPFIITEQTFPYEAGLTFVIALYRDGGWERVNAAFSDLPESTEQILHPAKYLERESPVEVALAPTDLGADWTLLLDRSLGEFYLRSHLRTQLNTIIANNAAAGWGGDRYHLYYNATTDERAWLLNLAWDTPEDAAEFNAAYQLFGDARYGDSKPDAACWSNTGEALCLDDEAGLIAFAPSVEIALLLLNSQE